MRKFISVMILMIGLLVTTSPCNQVRASSLPDQNSFAVNNQNKAPAALAQEEGGVASTQSITEEPTSETSDLSTDEVKPAGGHFFSDNWGALLLGLLGFFELVARLTPSEKDNSIINFLMTLFNAIIPNMKKGGGSFRLMSK